MSSRKNLKKKINYIMELLYDDCIFYKVYVVDANKEEADKILKQIAETHTELLKRVSVNEGKDSKGRVKAYYKKLREDLKTQTNAIAKQIAALGE